MDQHPAERPSHPKPEALKPLLKSLLGFAVISLPGWFTSWWALFSSTPPYEYFRAKGWPTIEFSAWWISIPVGGTFLLLILWELRKQTKAYAARPMLSAEDLGDLQRLHAKSLELVDTDGEDTCERPELQERILVRLSKGGWLTRDDIRFHFDGLNDQLLIHHTDTLESDGLIERVPLSGSSSRDRWRIAPHGRSHLVSRGMMLETHMLPPEKMDAFPRRILNVLTVSEYSMDELAQRTIIQRPHLEEQLRNLEAAKFVRINKGDVVKLTKAGRAAL